MSGSRLVSSPLLPPDVHLAVEHDPLERRDPTDLARRLGEELVPDRALCRVAQDEELAGRGAAEGVEVRGEAGEGGQREGGQEGGGGRRGRVAPQGRSGSWNRCGWLDEWGSIARVPIPRRVRAEGVLLGVGVGLDPLRRFLPRRAPVEEIPPGL